MTQTEVAAPLTEYDADSVFLAQDRHSEAAFISVPHHHRHHSTSGMGWGYLGSGPADLALNILARHLPVDVTRAMSLEELGSQFGLNQEPTPELTEQQWDQYERAREQLPIRLWDGSLVSKAAWDLHQQFKDDVVARVPAQGGVIHGTVIRAWIAQRR